MRSRAFALLNGIVLLATLACHSSLSPEEQRRSELTRREALWKAASVHSYTFDLHERAMVSGGPVRIEVRADTVYRVVDLATGHELAVAGWPTIDSLFAQIDSLDTHDGDWTVTVAYDARFGYPAHIVADGHAGDRWFEILVENFDRGPVALGA